MLTPDRCVVMDSLGIMPHAIFVNEMSAVRGNHFQHMSIDMIGNARNQVLRWRTQALRPIAAHQLVIPSDATRGDNYCLCPHLKLTHNHARTCHTSLDCAGFQYFTMDAINHSVAHAESSDTMPEVQCHQSPLHTSAHTVHKWL